MFHYYYLKRDNNSVLKGSNVYLKTFDDSMKTGTSIRDLKNFLNKNGVKTRL